MQKASQGNEPKQEKLVKAVKSELSMHDFVKYYNHHYTINCTIQVTAVETVTWWLQRMEFFCGCVVLYYFAVMICGARLQREYYLTIRGARSTFTFVSLTCRAGN